LGPAHPTWAELGPAQNIKKIKKVEKQKNKKGRKK
jgi:hypothetical protein